MIAFRINHGLIQKAIPSLCNEKLIRFFWSWKEKWQPTEYVQSKDTKNNNTNSLFNKIRGKAKTAVIAWIATLFSPTTWCIWTDQGKTTLSLKTPDKKENKVEPTAKNNLNQIKQWEKFVLDAKQQAEQIRIAREQDKTELEQELESSKIAVEWKLNNKIRSKASVRDENWQRLWLLEKNQDFTMTGESSFVLNWRTYDAVTIKHTDTNWNLKTWIIAKIAIEKSSLDKLEKAKSKRNNVLKKIEKHKSEAQWVTLENNWATDWATDTENQKLDETVPMSDSYQNVQPQTAKQLKQTQTKRADTRTWNTAWWVCSNVIDWLGKVDQNQTSAFSVVKHWVQSLRDRLWSKENLAKFLHKVFKQNKELKNYYIAATKQTDKRTKDTMIGLTCLIAWSQYEITDNWSLFSPDEALSIIPNFDKNLALSPIAWAIDPSAQLSWSFANMMDTTVALITAKDKWEIKKPVIAEKKSTTDATAGDKISVKVGSKTAINYNDWNIALEAHWDISELWRNWQWSYWWSVATMIWENTAVAAWVIARKWWWVSPYLTWVHNSYHPNWEKNYSVKWTVQTVFQKSTHNFWGDIWTQTSKLKEYWGAFELTKYFEEPIKLWNSGTTISGFGAEIESHVLPTTEWESVDVVESDWTYRQTPTWTWSQSHEWYVTAEWELPWKWKWKLWLWWFSEKQDSLWDTPWDSREWAAVKWEVSLPIGKNWKIVLAWDDKSWEWWKFLAKYVFKWPNWETISLWGWIDNWNTILPFSIYGKFWNKEMYAAANLDPNAYEFTSNAFVWTWWSGADISITFPNKKLWIAENFWFKLILIKWKVWYQATSYINNPHAIETENPFWKLTVAKGASIWLWVPSSLIVDLAKQEFWDSWVSLSAQTGLECNPLTTALNIASFGLWTAVHALFQGEIRLWLWSVLWCWILADAKLKFPAPLWFLLDKFEKWEITAVDLVNWFYEYALDEFSDDFGNWTMDLLFKKFEEARKILVENQLVKYVEFIITWLKDTRLWPDAWIPIYSWVAEEIADNAFKKAKAIAIIRKTNPLEWLSAWAWDTTKKKKRRKALLIDAQKLAWTNMGKWKITQNIVHWVKREKIAEKLTATINSVSYHIVQSRSLDVPDVLVTSTGPRWYRLYVSWLMWAKYWTETLSSTWRLTYVPTNPSWTWTDSVTYEVYYINDKGKKIWLGTASTTIYVDPAPTAPVLDTSPDAFSFTDVTWGARNTTTTSDTITVTWIDSATAISVSSWWEYSLDWWTTWTSTAWTVNNNDTVKVRHTESWNYYTTTDTTLTIWDKSDIFSSRSEAPPAATSLSWSWVTPDTKGNGYVWLILAPNQSAVWATWINISSSTWWILGTPTASAAWITFDWTTPNVWWSVLTVTYTDAYWQAVSINKVAVLPN